MGGVIEEIESLGKSQERELASRLFQLVMHLLKWIAQPSRRQTSRSWTTSIRNQRRELGRLLRQSPSLRHQVEDVLVEEYATAVDEAMHQTGLPREVFPPSVSLDRSTGPGERLLARDVSRGSMNGSPGWATSPNDGG